jgi:hypothetical protein
MSGTPSKMLEHLLDTRLNVQVGPNDDPFLDDFLLTHIVFMPIAQLVVSRPGYCGDLVFTLKASLFFQRMN